MARKNLLDGLTAVKNDVAPPAPRRSGGAIGAVGRSFADMRANSVIEVPADQIDAAGLTDRLGEDPDHAALVASIRDYGQQVPVLLRHSPNVEGRYEIVYGRRRVAALRVLRQPVRAMIRNLPDGDLIVAQGQENSARKDLSFIEKANFAGQMRDMGFERKVICGALHIDEAVVSKMLTVSDRVPESLIRAIGDAPRTGRDRWVAFARAVVGQEEAAEAAARGAGQGDSDARFEAALVVLKGPTKPAPKPATEAPWGQVKRGVRGTTISVPKQQAAFADWLVARMDDLHGQWAAETGSTTKEEEA